MFAYFAAVSRQEVGKTLPLVKDLPRHARSALLKAKTPISTHGQLPNVGQGRCCYTAVRPTRRYRNDKELRIHLLPQICIYYCIDGSHPFILTHCHHLIDGTVMVDFLRARGDEETRGGCCGARGGCCGVQIHTTTSSYDSERRTTRRRAHSLQIPRSTGKPDKTEEQRWRDPHNGYVDLISGV